MAQIYGNESWFNDDVRVYGCLYVNDTCGVIFTSPNGTKYNIVATNNGIQFGTVGIGGGGSGLTGSSITIVNNDGDTYSITATGDGISFQTPDADGDGEPDDGYVDITANSFTKVSGLSSEYLMADGSVSRRYIGVGVGSTPTSSDVGNDGDIWYTLC
jgi:hypothetical protein